MRRLTVLTAAAISCSAFAAPPAPAITPDQVRATVNGHLLMCKLALKNELLRAEADRMNIALSDESSATKIESAADCIKDKRAAGRTEFEKLAKTVKKPGARDALKSIQVAYLTAIEGIQPQTGERRGAYEQRQSQLESKLDEAWARFEVER